MSTKIKLLTLSVILFFGFVLRLHKLEAPLADWHSWRQVDTAAVARNFLKEGIDLLHPRYDDLSSIASGRENPQGYRMVEFPILAFLHVIFYRLFPLFSFEAIGRLLSVFSSLATIAFLFLIIDQIDGSFLAIITAFVYAVLPFNLYYNRVILPEPMMVATSLGAVYFFIRGLKKVKSQTFVPSSGRGKSKVKSIFSFLISGISLAVSLLLKPFAIFLIAPPILYLAVEHWLKTKKIYWLICLLAYLFIGLLPFLAWRAWIQQFPEGIPANMWLFNGDGIRFKGAWFYWLFAERLGKLILGYWGIVFFVLGLLVKPPKDEGNFFYLWLFGCLTYLAVVATGNVRHDYYQILIIPIICIFVAKGVLFLIKEQRSFNKVFCFLFFVLCFLFMEAFSWYYIRDFFNINHPEIVQAGQAVDNLVGKEEKVIAPYGADTAFLYQTGRKGWPIGGQIEEKIIKGADYYVSVKFDEETLDLAQRCQVLAKRENFIIISLKNCNF